ncbi:MAG: FtsX-like permease family protein, partial [Maribacter sp.]|nr:FtsX-like permease family protein [Maribacter sp.]
AFNRGDRVGWFAITANDGSSITELKEQIFDVMRERHTIHPEDKRAIGHFDLYAEYSKIEGLFGALNIVAFVVGILVLLSGIIGISNIMVYVVKERTKEIGIRKAIGATPKDVISNILLESTFITTISGFAGMIVGIAVLSYIGEKLAEDYFITNPYINLGVAIFATVILIVFGALAGYIPAKRAARIKPIIALRDE